MKYPTLQVEKKLWKKGYKRVVGLDEAGRGPLAGPVVAAAVTIKKTDYNPPTTLLPSAGTSDGSLLNLKLRDSKKLSPKKREELYKILTKHPNIGWGTGKVSEKIIDKINIKNAAELAMWRAAQKLKHRPDFLIIDGKYLKNYKLKTLNYKLIVKADEKVFSCAAASIIAKITRDRIMERYHKKYPRYGFDAHKGYPTKHHLKMLKKYRPSKIHRKSFKPVRKLKAKSVKRKTTAKN